MWHLVWLTHNGTTHIGSFSWLAKHDVHCSVWFYLIYSSPIDILTWSFCLRWCNSIFWHILALTSTILQGKYKAYMSYGSLLLYIGAVFIAKPHGTIKRSYWTVIDVYDTCLHKRLENILLNQLYFGSNDGKLDSWWVLRENTWSRAIETDEVICTLGLISSRWYPP